MRVYACALHVLHRPGPGTRRLFPATLLHKKTTVDRMCPWMCHPISFCDERFPREKFHKRRMKVPSTGTPETLILDVTRSTSSCPFTVLFHLTANRILNGYLCPFLDKDSEQKTTDSPSFRAVDSMLDSSSLTWSSCSRSTDNPNHKRVIPPGS
jgi:hypothetical protein